MFDWLMEIDLDWYAVALTVAVGSIFIAMIWMNPLWQESAVYTPGKKVFISIHILINRS